MTKQLILNSEIINKAAKVKCEICGREFEQITYAHLKIHNMTFDEYREQFPDALLVSEEARQKMSKASLGKPKTELHKQHMRDNSPDRSGELAPMYGRTGEESPVWKGGISFEPYCEKFDDEFKDRVRDFFNRCCYVCGVGQSELGQKLDVHHVNYDKMVCCNNVKPLFVPLCRSCHAKTYHNREYWEEFFTVSLEYLTNGDCFIPKERENMSVKTKEIGGEKI